MLDGVVRDLTATIGINEVLTNVTKFNTVCGAESSRSSVSNGAIAGMMFRGYFQVAEHVTFVEAVKLCSNKCCIHYKRALHLTSQVVRCTIAILQ